MASSVDQLDFNKRENKSDEKANKYLKKVGDGLTRTKAAASSGVRKVKGGIFVSLLWIKHKCRKTSSKH
ncbi:hypothetical protein P3X46_015381 [Hevea brasiliensis]|uniref:Uncharacterized protein n=1 Tax=Hevea brasiliensis TaxID=3981 RepID=A0ABQ9LX21_HEVBR|nr:hypothetical protein P3X46_015381 [Hevea brasiliensis]